MPESRTFETKFFQHLSSKRFAEAEREFTQIRKGTPKTEWNRGYTNALDGMLLAKRSNDARPLFLLKIDQNNRKELQMYQKEFSKNAKDDLYSEFDRGFFSAWANFLSFLLKSKR